MPNFLNKAQYNEEFLDKLINDHPHEYWDWKVTVIFYIAIHYLKGMAESHGVELGHNHKSIFENLENDQRLNIPSKILNKYSKLFSYSKASRYDGYIKLENFNRIQESGYNDSLNYLNMIRSHCVQECKKMNVKHALIN